ncbi:MAG TPA: methylated-DNA--[protein]-cysteine S-methyltransferase [Anaeromyxobacteraceae bacterium]|nr:methylated-DNA--[protein]-cysteine S-methyltransferase [Anaeromyxobacteraceae bacterium]
MDLLLDSFDSPLGPISLASDGHSLVALDFCPPERMAERLRARFGPGARVRLAPDPLGLTARARAYFAGDVEAMAGVPVEGGGTPFQRRVWAALREIPAGETESYSGLAARLGLPGGARAVGLANGRNPVAIAVPCHRVVGADGSLTGYAGGLPRKRWLLEHEQRARLLERRKPMGRWGAASR